MAILKELDELFRSETIKPTFDYVHIVLALYIFGEKENGIGRYRLKDELLIGSGTAKSLITKLNKNINFIAVSHKNKKRIGHVLTEKGLKYLNLLKKRIPIVKMGDTSVLKDMIIEFENASIFFCQVKNSGDKLTNGIEQRDAAIKVGGKGATCLIYDGKKLIYPIGFASETENLNVRISNNIHKYFQEELANFNSKLEKKDVIIIGLGNKQIEYDRLKIKIENKKKSVELASLKAARRARLAALNAALTLI
ncbi:MAG: DUF4443 domain-containing protein [Promethearchaeota archaeon]